MLKKNFANSIFYPLAALSAIYFILFAIVAYGIIEKGVKNSIEQNLKTSIELFSDSIRENLITGAESEVFRKCKAFIKNESIKNLVVTDNSGRVICDEVNSSEGNQFALTKQIHFDEDQTELAATISMSFVDNISSDLLLKSVLILLGTLCFLVVTYILISKFLIRSNIQSVTALAEILSDQNISSLKEISQKLPPSSVEEIRALYSGVENQARKVELYQSELVDATKWKAAHELASLVTHDIKSPLSNIEMIADDEENSPVLRSMLKNSVSRIYELIDEVMTVQKTGQNGKNDDICVFSLSSVLKNCIDVTNYSLKSTSNIKIKFQQKKNKHFDVLMSPNAFRRAVANILKNSVEAVDDANGKIDIFIHDNESHVLINIKDNGVGIDADKISELGKKGITLNKQGGTGFGLFQVKQMLKSVDGSLEIESAVGQGMSITVKIPKFDAEISVDTLTLENNQPIIIVDDEQSVSKKWKKKIDQSNMVNPIHYFSNSSTFKEWAESNPNAVEKATGLFDYDLKEQCTGLDLFKNYPLKTKILVTNDCHRIDVINACRSMRIGLVSKGKLPNIQGSENILVDKEQFYS